MKQSVTNSDIYNFVSVATKIRRIRTNTENLVRNAAVASSTVLIDCATVCFKYYDKGYISFSSCWKLCSMLSKLAFQNLRMEGCGIAVCLIAVIHLEVLMTFINPPKPFHRPFTSFQSDNRSHFWSLHWNGARRLHLRPCSCVFVTIGKKWGEYSTRTSLPNLGIRLGLA